MKKVCILDYGLGNVRSILNSLKKIKVEGFLYNENKKRDFDVLIIPGVGSFDTDRMGSSGELATPDLSDSIPLGRRGVPQDMANCIRFLVGPYATYISGQSIHLNGAYCMPH